MKGQLSREIRLQISVTRLKKGTEKLREKIAELVRSNKEKDQRIAELEKKLIDKESQRKELLSHLYKPGKKNRKVDMVEYDAIKKSIRKNVLADQVMIY